MQRFASIKTLVNTLDIDSKTAKQIRSLIKGETDPLDFQSARQFNALYFHTPDENLLILYAIDELLHTYGVKYIKQGSVSFHFCNNGDTYQPTIVYNHYSQRFQLRSWGSFFDPRTNPN